MPATSTLRAIFLGLAATLLLDPALMADQTFDRGLQLFEEGEYSSAQRSFHSSSDPRAGAMQAVVGAALGGCADALPKLVKAAADRDPTVARLAGLAAARCSIAGKKFDAALGVLNRLQAGYPTDPDVLYETARLYLKGWNEAVAAMFTSAPASFRVNQLSAEIFEIQGRYDEAVREYRKALEKAPGTINLHFRLGRAILMRSHEPAALEEALDEFQAELELNPNDAVAEFQVGQILQVTGKADEAETHFARAVELDPEFSEALVALAKVRLRQERFEEAIEMLERALELHPDSEPAHYSLMLAYRNAGRREDAERVQRDLDRLRAPAEGEFTEFLKRIGEAP